MKGNKEVIDLLNEVLTAELTAINQYYIHYKMLESWGYKKLAAKKRAESMEEMNMQRLYPVKVGENITEMHQVDLEVETTSVDRLNRGVAAAASSADNGSRALLEQILTDEEESVDWLEAHLEIIKKVGEERYLSEMIGSVE